MRVVLDIKDNKVDYILQLLGQYSYVKVKPIADKKAAKEKFLKELEGAVEEVKLIRAGKKKGTSLADFLNDDKTETQFASEMTLDNDWLLPNEDIAWRDL